LRSLIWPVCSGASGFGDERDREAAEEVAARWSALEPRAVAADGLSKSEIAKRLAINRRTAATLVEADEPPGYRRAAAGSMPDPLEPVLRRLLEE